MRPDPIVQIFIPARNLYAFDNRIRDRAKVLLPFFAWRIVLGPEINQRTAVEMILYKLPVLASSRDYHTVPLAQRVHVTEGIPLTLENVDGSTTIWNLSDAKRPRPDTYWRVTP